MTSQVIVDVSWRCEHPSSYPNRVLTLSTPQIINVLLSCAPSWMVGVSRFLGTVHLGLGVTMLLELKIHILFGLKYMFFLGCVFQLQLKVVSGLRYHKMEKCTLPSIHPCLTYPISLIMIQGRGLSSPLPLHQITQKMVFLLAAHF